MTRLLERLDHQAADPFAHDGYLGRLDRSTQRTHLAALIADLEVDDAQIVLATPDVAYYRFGNGWGAGVLIGDEHHPACSLGDAAHPFEMAILHGRQLYLCRNNAISPEVICPLDAAGVNDQLERISALPVQFGCRHRAPA
jgi:hypothetical protein